MKKRWLTAVMLAMGWLGATTMAAAEVKPVRLFAEAEDFTVVSSTWELVPFRENYFASTFAMTFLSRLACLGAPEQTPADQPAVAEQAIVIPAAGRPSPRRSDPADQ